uniref:Uncharacterized protein n=1 Tax=Aegilops tauschii subsp. strangulata TaxID=200361 RepID=A0A453PAZ1_AEGTS
AVPSPSLTSLLSAASGGGGKRSRSRRFGRRRRPGPHRQQRILSKFADFPYKVRGTNPRPQDLIRYRIGDFPFPNPSKLGDHPFENGMLRQLARVLTWFWYLYWWTYFFWISGVWYCIARYHLWTSNLLVVLIVLYGVSC